MWRPGCVGQYRSVSTPAAPDVPPIPRLVRRDAGRVIGGVAGGVADHLGVDAFRVRVVLVVLAALAGAGLPLVLMTALPPGHAGRAGLDGPVLTKPFLAAELAAQIERLPFDD